MVLGKKLFGNKSIILFISLFILFLGGCAKHSEMNGKFINFENNNDGTYILSKGVDEISIDGKIYYDTSGRVAGTVDYSSGKIVPDDKSIKPILFKYNEEDKVLQLGKGDSKSLYVKTGSKKYKYIVKHLQ